LNDIDSVQIPTENVDITARDPLRGANEGTSKSVSYGSMCSTNKESEYYDDNGYGCCEGACGCQYCGGCSKFKAKREVEMMKRDIEHYNENIEKMKRAVMDFDGVLA
jgi:hypothetical protein